MIKLLAMDMDGTLLNKHREISWGNLKALRDAHAKGVTLAIASGRAFFDISSKMREVDVEAHLIGANGATIHSSDGKLLGADFLDRNEALAIVQELVAQHYYIGVYSTHHIYVPEQGVDWLRDELQRLGIHEDRSVGFQGATRDDFYRAVDDWSVFETNHTEFSKIIIFSYDDEKLQKARETYEGKHKYSIVTSGTGNFEIMPPNVSKGNALDHLAHYLGIPLREVMAIGDNYNDLSMFDVAGVSVAMGNANDEIKNYCDRVTIDCNEDGVAHAIYEALGYPSDEKGGLR
ncbi:Cof-type HAD-IIB family hydrolase [Sporolactobacillus inulinus]|uniref:Hydrolase Cof n=1 Tax=Sporolactobacillus inulinus CASD TaxID=1069536 RepID=A0A0U1QN35_9BACL|nr:Cof-type HAD-IIB family hydrolase [Sporolactobacillus inulinus]KLI02219.1 hydrolase Cof [Sporolactobacillus inulinus CASD]GEB76896.1 HAD-superfamily hydrolase [Sporolactobacillus inulinus]